MAAVSLFQQGDHIAVGGYAASIAVGSTVGSKPIRIGKDLKIVGNALGGVTFVASGNVSGSAVTLTLYRVRAGVATQIASASILESGPGSGYTAFTDLDVGLASGAETLRASDILYAELSCTSGVAATIGAWAFELRVQDPALEPATPAMG